uniref:sushi domain-containing protein 3 isoform X4 n=1 Tax=Panthera onca TaxID=9690 RepID=UPI00295357B4|nr:sushi domain-containing protein 3 isoform X4 [Panthera onca]
MCRSRRTPGLGNRGFQRGGRRGQSPCRALERDFLHRQLCPLGGWGSRGVGPAPDLRGGAGPRGRVPGRPAPPAQAPRYPPSGEERRDARGGLDPSPQGEARGARGGRRTRPGERHRHVHTGAATPAGHPSSPSWRRHFCGDCPRVPLPLRPPDGWVRPPHLCLEGEHRRVVFSEPRVQVDLGEGTREMAGMARGVDKDPWTTRPAGSPRAQVMVHTADPGHTLPASWPAAGMSRQHAAYVPG